jgi:V/A-type H+-transporting ATPase subunit C
VSEEVREIVKGLTRKYEVENLKAALRLWFDRVIRKRNIDPYIGYLHREKIHYNLNIDQIINVDSIETIIDVLAKTPYAKVIKDAASQDIAKHLFPIELALDKYFYRQLYEKSRKLDNIDSDILKRMLGVEIDMENISWLMRFRDFYKMTMEQSIANIIPHGHHLDKKAFEEIFTSPDSVEVFRGFISKKYASLSSLLVTQGQDNESKLMLLNNLLDHVILYEVKKLKSGYPFSIGIVMAYFALKKNEIQKVMTILNAKYYNIEEERIKSVI